MKTLLQDYGESFRLASEISMNQDTEKLIYVVENWQSVNEAIKPIFNDLIESFGFYPYIKKIDNLDTAGLIRNEYHKSNNLINSENQNITFHFEQKLLEEKISNKKNLLISAPTSFGKSLLIEEFVARKKYANILIIQPTLALIDETRRKLKKYADFYNIIVNTKQSLLERNLFILTSERVLDIYSEIKNIDLFIVDEFYKISNHKKDGRASQLNIAFYKIMSKEPQLLLLTPNIDNVNSEFIDKYKLEFFKTEYSLVNQKIQKVSFVKNQKKEALFRLLQDLEEPTIVYVQSPARAEKLAKEYIEKVTTTVKKSFPIFEWIDENISPNWMLKNFLENGIGLHNGQYPRHIVNSQLDYFNNNNLDVIFATTSLIEGVNTVAKNIIIFEMKKGDRRGTQSITYFDFNNIKGRAGRMMKHYTGNIYYFDNPPEKQTENLDIPIIEQDEGLQSEVLVNLEKDDIKEQRREDYNLLVMNISDELLEIFKKNYYSVESQKKLYSYLSSNKVYLNELLWSTPTPKYEVLVRTLEIITQQLDGESGNTHKFLAQKCQQVMRDNLRLAISNEVLYQKGLQANKNKQDREIENMSISVILKFLKSQAKYEIPKKMKILESIVNYLSLDEKADYSAFIALLEHEGIDEELSVLLDFGVPASALKKIGIAPNSDVSTYIKQNLDSFGFNQYELDIVNKAF
ncbi:DEAD/DEAH box helicase [Paenilisteria newyorkensis]|nr:DEAD/DEAH box helicase [Listeria newyorkensis]KGL39972.1 helicase [Listeria newyorkensis]WAO21297.1 DEAD/DEAH box helicase [Listeria newyorkensis]SQC53342.1 ski2-like helicase [Listeria newyorkensis]